MTLRAKIKNDFIALRENLYYQETVLNHASFEDSYLAVRKKENRLYPDDIVKVLPYYSGDARLNEEWKVRQRSLKSFLQYLNQTKPRKTILELGCGNGWFSNQLARHTSSEIVGVDINKTEIEQAARVFADTSNVTFLLGDIMELSLFRNTFDLIILASSMQYFKEINSLVHQLLDMLSGNGEIHIIDSPVYANHKVSEAQERSDKYFKGFNSNLDAFYFHHTWSAFQEFNTVIQYKPSIFSPVWKKFGVRTLPFPWLIIRK